MRWKGLMFAALAAGASGVAPAAQDLAATCHASSSYDLTLAPDALLFDRSGPPPRRIRLHGGRLDVDGAPVPLRAEDGDRVALFEQDVRALAPRARRLALEGVDLAVAAVRAEAAAFGADARTRAELDRRLAEHGDALKRRIAASTSTHDWHGDAFDRYAADFAADVVPLLAADLARQAVAAALAGDLATAATLRDRTADLAGELQPRLERRLQVLRPRIQALCPSLQRLHELQLGLRDGQGRPLDLLDIGAP